MGKILGEPFKGELNSSDASSGVSATLYSNGSLDARTLQSDEYLEIHSVQVVSAVGGDVQVFTGADSTIGAGETVVRGTVAANGGLVQELEPAHIGRPGHNVFVDAPAGAVDLIVRGGIRKVDNGGTRPSWKE